jgi:hypothetical protein
MKLTAYRVAPEVLKIVPAPADRSWMDATDRGWANRCLPLRVANQCGWMVLNDCDFEALWNGSKTADGVEIRFQGPRSNVVRSHFGYGIVTWQIPYLFRTPPGWNLLARGPANWFKDGAAAMDGLIETDWTVASFTMNWKITRPHCRIRFHKDEPICMLVPQRRAELEAFEPEIRKITSEPELQHGYEEWAKSRLSFREEKKKAENPFVWQPDYTRGTSPSGVNAPEHQVKLKLNSFADPENALAGTGQSDPSSWTVRSEVDLGPAKEAGHWDIVRGIWRTLGSQRAHRPGAGKNA